MHDSHVHSIFSDDGMEAVEDVVATALSRGCDYVAITDHVNRDYQVIGYDNPQINMSAYVAAMQDFKRRFNKKNFRLAMGAELGFLKSANNLYIKDLPISTSTSLSTAFTACSAARSITRNISISAPINTLPISNT